MPLADPERVVPAGRPAALELAEARGREVPPVGVDVRNTGELFAGTFPGSANLPLAPLPRRVAEIPTGRPVVVHCAGGYRSSVAAALLRSHGSGDVSDLPGGSAAWAASVAQPMG